MLNLFKRASGNSPHNSQDVGGKKNGLEPPKNLPDLARDIYEREQIQPRYSSSSDSISPTPILSREETILPNQAKISEPSGELVPQLDLSLIKQRLASQQVFQQNSLDSYQTSQVPKPFSVQVDSPAHSQTSLPVQSPMQSSQYVHNPQNPQANNMYDERMTKKPIDTQGYMGPSGEYIQSIYSQYPPQHPQSSYSQQYPQTNYPPQYSRFDVHNQTNAYNQQLPLTNSQIISDYVDDSTGFFKEFEEHLRNNGLDNEIIEELLDRNLLEHMMFYHTSKSDSMPFYASSAELSHAIKLKFEDLQNLERNWIVNKQKLDLLKKLGSSLEADIHLRSEELKKLMSDSKRRGGVMRANDFFQVLKPKNPLGTVENSQIVGNSQAVANSPAVGNLQASTVAHVDVIAPKYVQTTTPVAETNLLHIPEHDEKVKYSLNSYITHDASKYFYSRDGQVFKSLAEFMDGIEIMDKGTFSFHANSSKNDFSNWIKGVFGDLRLSDVLRPLTDQERLWYYLRDNTVKI